MIQRGKVVVWNRLPGSVIWACSGRFLARIVLQRALLRRGNFFISKSWKGCLAIWNRITRNSRFVAQDGLICRFQ